MPTPTATTAAAATSELADAVRRRRAQRSTTSARGAVGPVGAFGAVVGEAGQHPVEAGDDVGGHRLGVPGVGEEAADALVLGGVEGALVELAGVLVLGHRVPPPGRLGRWDGWRRWSASLSGDRRAAGLVTGWDGPVVGRVPRPRARPAVGSQVTQQGGEPGATAGAARLHGALGAAEHLGDLGDGVALHVDQHQRGPLLGGSVARASSTPAPVARRRR